ncbi:MULTISPECIES: RidA family protein [unclassified Marinobacter]|jgi:enamine deaminase RidA (YjgF/YER057c/UK114 family)|uniref:RidA family protein n=1 Tax=unclassified Marinobacter TaxID=83889 RepID=UPI002010871F|nr:MULTISPECIES: RidA family protein [unclassified Marinobacter]MCL1479644.1 RidA family protein [Marinobacter sp.]MCL1485221.1 RidA family protein [Marinobacter sp.]MCL1488865.1 RidA family protein [Marinobacter sp.]UQG55020.1 RidA family protein [Marinobacter sp. M4C]UQG63821.1 RidA family protein [Marinobacter sp. M2C]
MTVGTEPIRVEPDVFSAFAIGQGHCVGNLVFLSGQAGINDAGEVVGPGDVNAQIEQAMSNIKRALESVGSGIERIFKITVYLTDMANFEHVMTMRHRYFCEPWPADTTVGVQALALPELMIELDVIATRTV